MTGSVVVNSPEALATAENVSRETLASLERYVELLDTWRTKINLIGPKEWPNIWNRHIWDSAQLFSHVDPDARILDLGSGAGFPGLVLAAYVTAEGSGEVTLIERTGKKCAFLREVIDSVGLKAQVIQETFEAVKPFSVDIVTARAFAHLPKLLDLAAPWLETGAVGYFHKGENWKEELTKAAERWIFAHEAIPSRSGGSGIILKVSEIRRAG